MNMLIKVDNFDWFRYDFVMISHDNNSIVCFFNLKAPKVRNKREIKKFISNCESLKEFEGFLIRQNLIVNPLKNYGNKYITYEILPKKTYLINKNLEKLSQQNNNL